MRTLRSRRLFTRIATVLAATAAAFTGVVVGTANAEPLWGGDYARVGLAYEGRYPANTPCSGAFRVVDTDSFTWYGRVGTLKLYYHGSCGAYARADNIESYCYVRLNRLEPGETGRYHGWVTETTDGLNYAYTQMANNLNGRLARGSVICSGMEVADVGWY
ncbi:hypothetical protein [Amycolatopsis sp. ATCC 39116]|uniref:hypothetical protein n=1 Tax=Amycolatopsis sp. (strain ATCC 39116 / 75iv2) TaxID=385957 RepID=UPI0002626E3F|nr:hypothetical protein [Amycolatopsis sp. ATCC 39116]